MRVVAGMGPKKGDNGGSLAILIDGVFCTVFVNRAKCMLIGLLALALAGAGTGLVVQHTRAQPPPAPRQAEEEPEVKPRPATTPEARMALLKARVAAARKAYEGELETLAQSTRFAGILKPDPESICRWSVRWLRAEQDLSPNQEHQVAARQAHFKRMAKLHVIVKEMSRDRLPSFNADVVEWYRLEAELWLSERKAAEPHLPCFPCSDGIILPHHPGEAGWYYVGQNDRN